MSSSSTSPVPAGEPPVVHGMGSVLLTAALTLSCLPYLVFGPIAAPSQVQPWAALLCWAFLLHRLLTGQLLVDRFQIILAAFALWFMLDVYQPDQVGIDYYLRRSAAFLISWSIVVAMRYVSPSALWRILKISLPAWTLFGVIGYVSPALYYGMTRPLVPTAVGVAGGRGTSSLAPEATDFGFTMAFMLLICLIVRRCLHRDGNAVPAWPVWLAGINVLLSQSGSGIFALVALGALLPLIGRHLSTQRRAIRWFLGGLATVAVLVVVGAMPATGVRGIDLLVLTLHSPSSLLNTTVSYRVVHNTVGVLGMLDSRLLGYGAGAFLIVGPHLYDAYDLGRVFGLTGWYAANVPLTLSISPVAFFPVILLEYGLAGLVYILILFRGVGLSGLPYKPLCLLMMFLTWVQSFPAAYPPFWLIVGLAANPAFREAMSIKGYRLVSPKPRRLIGQFA